MKSKNKQKSKNNDKILKERLAYLQEGLAKAEAGHFVQIPYQEGLLQLAEFLCRPTKVLTLLHNNFIYMACPKRA